MTDEEERAAQPPYSPGDSTNNLKPVSDSTHRKLKPRHVQLIGIGGYVTMHWDESITGTAMLIKAGTGLSVLRCMCRLV